MMLSIFAVGLTAGSTNVSTIVHNTALLQGIVTDPPPHLMALAALFIVTLAETGRVPVDNPATHLELTMIHEAMVLEYSGRYLALVEWAAAMKLLLMLTLLSNIFAPWGIAIQPDPASLAIGLGVWLAKVSALALLVGLIESMFAKLRLFRVTDLLGVAFILSLLALVFFYILRGTP
jgi:formate hydrogenlyase subunit 4